MLRDMYAHNLTEDVIKNRIIEQIDTAHFKQITQSTLEGLAKKELNLSAYLFYRALSDLFENILSRIHTLNFLVKYFSIALFYEGFHQLFSKLLHLCNISQRQKGFILFA